MKETGMLFKSPMMRAIISGAKTQTRRVVKDTEVQDLPVVEYARDGMPIFWSGAPSEEVRQSDYYDEGMPCPWGGKGDRIWCRETFALDVPGCEKGISYRADHNDPRGDGPAHPMKWRPSIFMPRWACRCVLEIVDVRVERLHEITNNDAIDEGFSGEQWHEGDGNVGQIEPWEQFRDLWQVINGKKHPWEENPWLWAIRFKRLETP